MEIADEESAVFPKKIDAIKPAVIPYGLAVLVFPIIQIHHGDRWRAGIVMAKQMVTGLSPKQVMVAGAIRFHRLAGKAVVDVF